MVIRNARSIYFALHCWEIYTFALHSKCSFLFLTLSIYFYLIPIACVWPLWQDIQSNKTMLDNNKIKFLFTKSNELTDYWWQNYYYFFFNLILSIIFSGSELWTPIDSPSSFLFFFIVNVKFQCCRNVYSF